MIPFSATVIVVVAMAPTMGANGHHKYHGKERASKFESSADFKSSFIGTSGSSVIEIDKETVSTASIDSTGASEAANHWVEVNGEFEGKLDMRVVFEKLENIPEIRRLLTNLTSKIDKCSSNNPTTKGISSDIIAMQQWIQGGFENVNKLTQAIFQDFVDGPFQVSYKKTLQMLEIVGILSQNPFTCDLREIEKNLESFKQSVKAILTQSDLAQGQDEIIQIIRGEKLILAKVMDILRIVDQKITSSSAAITAILRKTQANSDLLNQLVAGLLPGSGAEETDHGEIDGIKRDIRALTESQVSMKTSIAHLTDVINGLATNTQKFFSMQQQIVVRSQYSVQQTAKTIQRTASSTKQAVKEMVREAARVTENAGRMCKS